MKTKTGIFLSLLIGLAAACVPTSVQNSPSIVVPVTVVDHAMLGQAVAVALTATASSHTAATETALAVAGVTLTPTASPTFTPSSTATTFSPPTPTATPTNTSVPTTTPLPPNTPSTDIEPVNGQLRVVHAWGSQTDGIAVDVYIDEVPIAIGLEPDEATSYYSIDSSQTVRVMLMQSSGRPGAPNADGPLLEQAIEVPQGSSTTLAIIDGEGGPQFLTVPEDVSPLETGKARATFVNVNPKLPPFDINESPEHEEVVIVRNMALGEYRGPFDLPAKNYNLQLADSDAPDQILVPSMALTLDTNLNYLVLLSQADDTGTSTYATKLVVFPGSTRMGLTDTPVHFVNAAPKAGPLTFTVNGLELVRQLNVGEATFTQPVSRLGGSLIVADKDGNTLTTVPLSPWPAATATNEQIIVVYDASSSESDSVGVLQFTRIPPPSLALANVRLIDALTGTTQTVDLEMRATNPTEIANPIGIPKSADTDTAWSSVIRNIGFGDTSDYVTRAWNIFDLRVVLSASGSVQASLERQPFLPGGAYDVLALPGATTGQVQLLVLGPDPQVSLLGSRRGDPQVVQQIVDATLTALAPEGIATLSSSRTPTPTISPVPTNTPRPTNTPLVKIPAIQVNPEPPNAASGSFILIGQNFKANARYSVNLDDSGTLFEGLVSAEGEVALTVNLPPGIAPGPHVVRVCADCREGGAQQETLAAFLVADPRTTPTQTPQS